MKVAAVNHRKPDRCAFQRFGCVQPAETSPDEHHAMRGRCRHTRASPFACRGLACRNRDAVSWPYISWVVYHARGALPGGNRSLTRNFAQPQWRCIDPRRVSARRLKWAGGRRAEGNSVDGETAGEPKMGRGTTRSPQEKKGVATA